MKQIHKRLTYANVMSSFAVFLVLGGATAFAATQLDKNSVGTEQLVKNSVTGAKIKKDAVTGPKVKDQSLEAADFKPGQLPSGPQGPKGDKGEKGDKGDAGASATNLWAVLDGSGSVVRGSGTVSASHPSLGHQTVVFNRSVTGCTFLATGGTLAATNGNGSSPSTGQATIGPLEGNNAGVVLTRADDAGVLKDFPVYVAVLC